MNYGKQNIVYKNNYLKDRITYFLKSLFYKDYPLISRLNAVSFLAKYIHSDQDLMKRFVYLYEKEQDYQVREAMKSAIDSSVEESINDFDSMINSP